MQGPRNVNGLKYENDFGGAFLLPFSPIRSFAIARIWSACAVETNLGSLTQPNCR